MSQKCTARRKSDGEPCEAWAVTGEDKCRMHLGKNGDSHDDNQNARTHGAFSKHWRSDLTGDEIDSLDALMDHLKAIDDERTLAAEVAAEALVKYKRSADSRFLREARQWVSEFNLLPNEDITELRGEGGGGIVFQLGDSDG